MRVNAVKKMTFLFFLVSCFFFTTLAFSASLVFKDPKKDDKGPGTYSYPTHRSYKRGDFDITKVKISESGSNVVFKIYLKNTIRDPWKSKSWGGNGWSVQFAQVYIHTGAAKGWKKSLPGMNVRFTKKWNKVVLISPQGKTRLKSEINLKARQFKKGVVVPTSTRKSGKTLIAVVPKSALGGFKKTWGFQVLMQSNEGFPRKKDLLTRPVNEYNGKHRFGGGNDGDCDPHVIDMLAGKAKGKSSEKKAQYKALKYSCKGTKKQAVVPFVFQ